MIRISYSKKCRGVTDYTDILKLMRWFIIAVLYCYTDILLMCQGPLNFNDREFVNTQFTYFLLTILSAILPEKNCFKKQTDKVNDSGKNKHNCFKIVSNIYLMKIISLFLKVDEQ